MREDLLGEGEAVSLGRVARLTAAERIKGWPRRKMRGFRRVASGRLAGVKNLLERNITAQEPKREWGADIAEIGTGRQALSMRVVLPVQQAGNRLVDASTLGSADGDPNDGGCDLKRQGYRSVVLHSHHGSRFTSADYQRFPNRNTLVCSLSAVGHCGDNAACEGLFG